MTSYCEYIVSRPGDSLNRAYHDTDYGFPLRDDNLLFERLVFEINQAGLSWITILKKAQDFRRAYDGFDIDKVADYHDADVQRLLSDAGIIRNRLKVKAAIENARRVRSLRLEFGSFKGWLDVHHPSSPEDWTRLFKRTFVFTGGEIVREFLVSTGYLPGAHDRDCPIYAKVIAEAPPWAIIARAQSRGKSPER